MTFPLYATLDELLAEAGDVAPPDDAGADKLEAWEAKRARYELALADASRAWDLLCGVNPGYFCVGSLPLDGVVSRVLTTKDPDWLWTGAIASSTGVVVKIDEDGDRTFETTLSASTDYYLEPDIGPPYWRIAIDTMNGTYRFPTFRRGVQVTAPFGWSLTTPGPVRRAVLLMANRYRERPNSPMGIQEGAEQMMALAQIDPDVTTILQKGQYAMPRGLGVSVAA